MVDGAYRDRDRATPDDRIDPVSLVSCHELGVVETGDAVADAQHHGPADDGARQRTHADLVDAGHDLVAHGKGTTFELPELRSHLFESKRRPA